MAGDGIADGLMASTPDNGATRVTLDSTRNGEAACAEDFASSGRSMTAICGGWTRARMLGIAGAREVLLPKRTRSPPWPPKQPPRRSRNECRPHWPPVRSRVQR